MFLKNIKFKKINTDDLNNNFFLCDYNFDKINIDKISIQKNNSILSLKSINYKYDNQKKYLQINIIDDNRIPIILYIKNVTDKTKKVYLDISFIDEKLENQKILILHNKTFDIKTKNNQFSINLSWSGPKNYINKYVANKFNENSEYLYWYNLKNINLDSIEFNKKLITYDINDSSKDYIIFNFDKNDIKYFVYIVKSITYKGCSEISIKTQNNDNVNMIYSIEALYNNQIINIDDYTLKLKWNGLLDNVGYQIKNVSDEFQRDIGKSLNTFELFTHNLFTFKIHYFVGLNDNSINLNEWNSYYNYLDILKKLLSYCLDYALLLNLRLPLNDINLIKNGGGPSYDIYVLNKETQVIDNGINNNSSNYFDKVTYLILSNKLSYDELKSEIFQNIFYIIIASYNWFNEKWISDGLSILFEYLINDYSKITLEKHLGFIKNKNLSISNNINHNRSKDSFIFFYYLMGIYGNGIFNDILKISDKYSHYNCIENYLTENNPLTSFTQVLIDFWTALNILSNSNNIDKRFRLANSEDIKSLINIDNENLVINNFNNDYKLKNLENTGSKCYNIIFENTDKGNINFSGNFPVDKIHKRVLIEYYDKQQKVLEIEPTNNFNIEINDYVSKVKLLIVADKEFIDNEEITINTKNYHLNF